MADVLEQGEVDALLSAMNSGEIETRPKGEAGPGPELREVRTYDFKRPERVSKDQMRALEAIHSGFSRNFGASLSGSITRSSMLSCVISCATGVTAGAAASIGATLRGLGAAA